MPQLLRLVQNLGTLHPEEEEHRHDGQQRRDGVCDDVLERVVVGNEKNVKNCRGRKIPSQETAGVRKNCLGVDDRQTEEGDGPHAVENL